MQLNEAIVLLKEAEFSSIIIEWSPVTSADVSIYELVHALIYNARNGKKSLKTLVLVGFEFSFFINFPLSELVEPLKALPQLQELVFYGCNRSWTEKPIEKDIADFENAMKQLRQRKDWNVQNYRDFNYGEVCDSLFALASDEERTVLDASSLRTMIFQDPISFRESMLSLSISFGNLMLPKSFQKKLSLIKRLPFSDDISYFNNVQLKSMLLTAGPLLFAAAMPRKIAIESAWVEDFIAVQNAVVTMVSLWYQSRWKEQPSGIKIMDYVYDLMVIKGLLSMVNAWGSETFAIYKMIKKDCHGLELTLNAARAIAEPVECKALLAEYTKEFTDYLVRCEEMDLRESIARRSNLQKIVVELKLQIMLLWPAEHKLKHMIDQLWTERNFQISIIKNKPLDRFLDKAQTFIKTAGVEILASLNSMALAYQMVSSDTGVVESKDADIELVKNMPSTTEYLLGDDFFHLLAFESHAKPALLDLSRVREPEDHHAFANVIS